MEILRRSLGSVHFMSSYELFDLKLSHERFGQKREVFEVLGRVLLGVVVTKLSLQEKG